MRKGKRKAVVSGIVGLLTMFAFVGAAEVASADVFNGGGGGGAGGGGGGGSLTWEYYGPNTSSLRLPGRAWSNTPAYGVGRTVTAAGYDGTVPGFQEVAGHIVGQEMTRLQAACGGTIEPVIAVYGQSIRYGTQWSSWANTSSWNDQITYAELAERGGPAEAVEQLRAMGNVPIGQRTVVCVTQGDDYRWVESPQYAPDNEVSAMTCTYSRAVTVKRQINGLVEGGVFGDPIGKNNLHDQSSQGSLTPYGTLINSYNNTAANGGTLPTPAQMEQQLREACNNSAGSARPNVDLSERNKEGLAEGGILNISETARDATYLAIRSFERYTGCIRYQESSPRGENNWRRTGRTDNNCTRTYPERRNVGATNFGANQGSQVVTGFWQILSVHCNAAGFNALVNSTPGVTVQGTPDPTRTFSAVAYSRKHNSVPAVLDFGSSSGNASAANRASAGLGFYDKECPFVCTSDSSGMNATAANGATDNSGNQAPAENGTVEKYGAVSGVSNNNKFTFFRDNAVSNVRLDTWYPVNGNGVNYNGQAPLSTTFNRWEGGTPGVNATTGGSVTMTANGTKLFTGSAGTPANQRNWNTSLTNTNTSTSVRGLVNNLEVKSTWASETNKPHVLNVKWEFAPNIATTVPLTNIGFNSNGSVSRGTPGTVSAPIEGKCYAQFGTGNSLNTNSMFANNTGSGTTNDLDRTLVQGATTGKPTDDSSNLFLEWVRSTTE